ncbi:hypothetical protein E2C01_087890 [Portunus trituberculatus]|uniref:Uncharacterized protein n=1 Tax=Portunus trituberculatus TaxID=210409 RepID=A0A5B7JKJ0_PORTR|nr:hypothetical protein [Portunus trituberculatus]
MCIQINPFRTETHFYHDFLIFIYLFICMVKRLMARIFTILIPTQVSEAV